MTIAPVVYSFYRRPEVTRIVMEALREAKPIKLYLFSDAPQNDKHASAVDENRRQVLEMIDWDCEVVVQFLEHNVGVWGIYQHILDYVFQFEDRLIYLEEDILPNKSFFNFCNTLLERYKDDDRVYMIGGMNGKNIYPSNVNFDYFFTETTTAWGHALWKRTYDNFRVNKSFMEDSYTSHVILNYLKFRGQVGWYKNLVFNALNPNNLMDHGMEFYLMGLNQNVFERSLAIVPVKNLVLNIGDTHGAEHSDDPKLLPRKMRKTPLELHDLSNQITPPLMMIPDYYYGAQTSKPPSRLELFLLKTERAIRVLLLGGPNYFKYKFSRRLTVLKHMDEKEKLFKNELIKINESLNVLNDE